MEQMTLNYDKIIEVIESSVIRTMHRSKDRSNYYTTRDIAQAALEALQGELPDIVYQIMTVEQDCTITKIDMLGIAENLDNFENDAVELYNELKNLTQEVI